MLALYRHSPRWQEDWLSVLADILAVALGLAIASTILVEVIGRMVLLIPDAVRKIKAQGHAEGREEGREEGHAEGREEGRAEERAAQHKRQQEAYDRFGVEVNGVLMLPNTREVAEFLSGESEQKP